MECINTIHIRNNRSIDIMMRTNKTLAYHYNDNHGYSTYYKCFEDFVEDYFIEDSVDLLKKILAFRKQHIKKEWDLLRNLETTMRANVYDGDKNG